jgi:carnitine monooxygenase subunit
MNAALRPGSHPVSSDPAATDDDAYSLPSWIYSDPGFFEREKAAIFRTSW